MATPKTAGSANPVAQIKADYNPEGIRQGIKNFLATSATHRKQFGVLTGEIAELRNRSRQLTIKMNTRKASLEQGITKEQAPNERTYAQILNGRCEADPEYVTLLEEQEAIANNLADKEAKLAISKAEIDSAREDLSAQRMMAEMFMSELGAVAAFTGVALNGN